MSGLVLWLRPAAIVIWALIFCSADATPIRIAVASNFYQPMTWIVDAFQKIHPGSIDVIQGSTGKLYAQIMNGAPYDLFFAADEMRPRDLIDKGVVKQEDFGIYVHGRLALWIPKNQVKDHSDKNSVQYGRWLKSAVQGTFAIANPRHAPYGKAALQVLEHLGVPTIKTKFVYGENVAQVFQYLRTGNVAAGFLAYPMLKTSTVDIQGEVWLVPAALHEPIIQAYVQLKETKRSRLFRSFLTSAKVRDYLSSIGYELP